MPLESLELKKINNCLQEEVKQLKKTMSFKDETLNKMKKQMNEKLKQSVNESCNSRSTHIRNNENDSSEIKYASKAKCTVENSDKINKKSNNQSIIIS